MCLARATPPRSVLASSSTRPSTDGLTIASRKAIIRSPMTNGSRTAMILCTIFSPSRSETSYFWRQCLRTDVSWIWEREQGDGPLTLASLRVRYLLRCCYANSMLADMYPAAEVVCALLLQIQDFILTVLGWQRPQSHAAALVCSLDFV